MSYLSEGRSRRRLETAALWAVLGLACLLALVMLALLIVGLTAL